MVGRFANRKPIVVIVSARGSRAKQSGMKHVASGQLVACGTIVRTSKNYRGPTLNRGAGYREIFDFESSQLEGDMQIGEERGSNNTRGHPMRHRGILTRNYRGGI